MVYCNSSLSEAQAGAPAGLGRPPLLSGYFPEVYGAVVGGLGVIPSAIRWVCLPSLPAAYAELLGAGKGEWGCDVVLLAPIDVYLLSEGVNFSRSVYDESFSILVPVRECSGGSAAAAAPGPLQPPLGLCVRAPGPWRQPLVMPRWGKQSSKQGGSCQPGTTHAGVLLRAVDLELDRGLQPVALGPADRHHLRRGLFYMGCRLPCPRGGPG